jgi:hypothetical protein
MYMNRNRPTGVKKEQLDLWFSQVINDAIRDAHDVGMNPTWIIYLLRQYLKQEEERRGLLKAKSWSEKKCSVGLWGDR